jgi:protein required for attachment to host cells
MATAKRWIVVADGRHARLYEQLRPGAALSQIESLDLTAEDEKEAAQRDRPPRAHDRFGEGRHAMDKGVSLHEEAEARFLARVTNHLEAQRSADKFDEIILIAPPRALGILRTSLSHALKEAVKGSMDLDLINETPEQLRTRLSDAGFR